MTMKIFAQLVLGAAAAAMSLACSAAAVEGTDYVVLSKPLANATGTITKVFSYDCPFCYKYDVSVDPAVLPKIESEAGLKFNPVHLETKGKYGRTASLFLAMCMLQDQAKGISPESRDSQFKKAKDAIYKAYHRAKERWTAGEDAFIKTMAAATGIQPEAFAKSRTDAKVVALADSWKPSYDVAKIQGIPAYVVNGKYLMMTKNITSLDGMLATVKELAAKK